MSSSINVVLGPYIKINGDLKKSVIKIKRICPNHPKVLHKDAKFCPVCGSQIQNEDYTDIEHISLNRLLDNHGYSDSLFNVEYLRKILIPNQNPPNKVEIDTDEQNEINLTDVNKLREDQLNWMHKTYYNEINMLKENFGDDNVIVTWGLLTYWC